MKHFFIFLLFFQKKDNEFKKKIKMEFVAHGSNVSNNFFPFINKQIFQRKHNYCNTILGNVVLYCCRPTMICFLVQFDVWFVLCIVEFIVLLTLGFHPARSIMSLHRGSTEVCELITTCLEVYRRSPVGSSLSQIKDLLSNCDSLTIAQVTTDDG